MSNSRGNAAWVKAMQRAQWAAHFTAFGTLYSTGYEAEEVRLIKRELRRMGIPVGGTRLDKAPRQLEPHELVHRDDGAPEEEPASFERHSPAAVRWHGWYW
jgi:hypothetical protein